MTDEPETPTLRQELEQLEADLGALNERRADLYRRSLEASQGDKACTDLVSAAMLGGPLAATNKIPWPVELAGIAWTDGNSPCYLAARAWVRVRPFGAEKDSLGFHIGDVATGVQARLGEGDLLHLSHVAHAPVLYVPELGQIVSGLAAQWHAIEGPEGLEDFDGDGTLAPWVAQAERDLTTLEVVGPAEQN
jgi:hypothetical protein